MTRLLSKTRWLTHYVLPTIILVGSGVAFYAMGSRPDVPRKPKTAATATVVEVAEVQPLSGPLIIETTGEVVPHRVLSIASEVQGRIVFKHEDLRVGERVQADETLIRIDPKRFALAVERLEIMIEQASAGLKRTRQRQSNITEQLSLSRKSHEILKEDVQRLRKLQQSRATSVAEVSVVEKQELDARLAIEQIEGQQRSLQIELAEQELVKQLATVQLEEAQVDQAAADITAPVSGIVVAAPQEEYAMVQMGDPLLSMEESGCLEVHCHLKIDEMAWVWSSQSTAANGSSEPDVGGGKRITPVVADVVYNVAGNTHKVRGKLVRQHGAGLDPTTRTIACRVLIGGTKLESLPEGQIPLMTGMFVNVQVQCHPNRPLLRLPEQGIRTDGTVWLMRNAKLCAVPVKTVQSRGGFAIVEAESDNIQPGDRVIVSPVAGAKDGLAVREQKAKAIGDDKIVSESGQTTPVGRGNKVEDTSR